MAAGTAEQVIDRGAELLADDIPERDLDSAEGAIGLHGAAFDENVVVHHVGKVLDVEWIATDEELAHPIDVGRYGRLAVGLGVGLAPAGDPLVGIDPDEDEILWHTGRDQEVSDAGDLHIALTSLGRDAGDFSMGLSGSSGCPMGAGAG